MTQEEKQLLLKDLCARLPYGVNLHVEESKKLPDNEHISIGFIGGYALNKEGCQDFLISEVLESLDNGSVVKLYLRPMSSMTEEEGKELEDLFCEIDAPCWVDTEYGCVNFAGGNDFIDTEMAEVYTDWLNAHHFDYRGLIEKGLALEAPEGMYKTE